MGEFSNTAGCAIEGDYIYLARRFDEFDLSTPFTRMSFYDGQDTRTPWKAHDVEWRTVSVCVWRGGLGVARVYVALSTEGDVELIGPSNQPQVIERIAGAGLSNAGARGQGHMARVRQVGAHLFACGSGFLTFRRTPERWGEITGLLDGEAAVGQGYLDINGHHENQVFAVGPDSSTTSRISYFDGRAWRRVVDGFPDTLTSVIPAGDGGMYIGGWNGILHGHVGTKFSRVVSRERLFITDMAEFRGRLFFATTSGVFSRNDDDGFERCDTKLKPGLGTISHLDPIGDVLWAFGPKDIAFYDGSRWTRIADPDNAR